MRKTREVGAATLLPPIKPIHLPPPLFKRRPSVMQHVPTTRSHKQLFLSDYLKKAKRRDKRVPESRLQAEARDLWRNTDKKEKKKWLKMLEPQRQRYIEAYTSEIIP